MNPHNWKNTIYWLVLACVYLHNAEALPSERFRYGAFVSNSSRLKIHQTSRLTDQNQLQFNLTPFPMAEDVMSQCANNVLSKGPALALLANESGESWRQYVPLAVSCLVILDILLGSPAANLVMAPLREAKTQQGDDDEADGFGLSGSMKKPRNIPLSEKKKERVDSDAIAMAALEKARNSKELRDYLERTKTEADKMEDMRKKIDKQMADMEE